jgi:uncharacterized protein RhaS with RHS repeats
VNRDPIEERGGVNLYGMVGNDPVNRWDVLGLDTYVARRKLGGGPATPVGKLFAHEFAFVVDEAGVITTYSWGNSPTANNPGSNKWFKNMPEDLTAAEEALREGLLRREGGVELDYCMEEAFSLLAGDARSNHFNWGVTSNCKTETCKLIDRAKSILNSIK